MKKDLRIHSWGRRIEGFTVGEEGMGKLQSGEKDRGTFTVGEEGLGDLQ